MRLIGLNDYIHDTRLSLLGAPFRHSIMLSFNICYWKLYLRKSVFLLLVCAYSHIRIILSSTGPVHLR